MKKPLFLLFFCFVITSVFGQVPPLQLNVVLVPPYSVYLPDHAAAGQEQLRINIVQTDRNQPSYDFLLRIEILHQGSLLMRTRADFRPFPLTITPGKLLTLSGNMVLPYLLEENLDFINYSRDLYYRTKALPEGTITIRVTAFDYYRPNIGVSQTAQTQFWLSKNDPPYLTNPSDKQQLPITHSSVPITFMWQNRNFSPNSLLSTTYRFQLFEVYDPQSNPNQIVVSQPPFYERELTTSHPSFSYGISDPPLTLGKQYVWRVQSIDRSGRDMYKNKGWSMASRFQYGQDPATAPLPPVTGLSVHVKENRATISWDYHPDHKEYEIFFHNENMEENRWNKVVSRQLKYTADYVPYDEKISVKVRALNGERYSPETYPEEFLCEKPPLRQCGVHTPALPPIDPATPLLKSLPPGTVFRCDKNFVYTVKQVERDGEGFTGEGTVPVPLFGNRVMGITFKHVKVNEDLRYVSGAINFKQRKEGGKGIVDLDKTFEGSASNNGKGGIYADTQVDFTISDHSVVENIVVVNDSTFSLTIKDANGTPQTVEIPFPNRQTPATGDEKTAAIPDLGGKTIQDKSGTVFSVTPDGKGGYSLTPQARQEEKVTFPTDSVHNRFAELDFNVADKESDYYKMSKLELQYTKTVLFEESYGKLIRDKRTVERYYFLPIFSVNPGENLKITGKFVSNTDNVEGKKVKFMTTEGVTLTSQYDAATKEFTLTLPPSAAGNSQRYFAVCEHQKRQLVLGGFEVMTYPEKVVNLTLVPVNKIGETNNKVDVNSITAYLNKVYGVANVKFNVKLAESFDYNGETKFMVNEKSGFLENYTPSMLEMNNAYLEKVGDKFDKNSLYLFLLNFGAGSNDMAGFMPRQSQIGYIFLNNNKVVERTIAHELGHGLAAMSHTFNAKYGNIPVGLTNNLMDYGVGIAMQKLQWDLLHSKVVVWKVFERDKEGMAVIEHSSISGHNHGIAPDGRIASFSSAKFKIVGHIAYNSYFIHGFDTYDTLQNKIVESYSWSGADYVDKQKQSIANSADITLKYLTKGLADNVNIYYLISPCLYQYGAVKHTSGALPIDASGITWKKTYVYNASANCMEYQTLANDRNGCSVADIENGFTRLKTLLNVTQPDSVVEGISRVCLESLRRLTYPQIIGFIRTVAQQKTLKEPSEMTILRLMKAMDAKDYRAFYQDLEANNHELIKHLVAEIDDVSLFFWIDGNNYTNFIGALVTMFRHDAQYHLDKMAEVGTTELLQQVISLNPQSFQSDIQPDILGTIVPLHQYKYTGKYNQENGTVSISKEEQVQINHAVSNASSQQWLPSGTLADNLSPLTPIVISSVKELPLVATALGTAESSQDSYRIVPAIFLKYRSDKENNAELEKAVMTTLDLATIAGGGGTAVATKIHWVKRVWALAEVAGAVGNIVVNHADVSSKMKGCVDIYNGAMGLIGVYHVGKGVVNFAKSLPDATKNLLRENKSLQAIIKSKYLDWQAEITKLGDLTPEELKLKQQQEQVWRMLGVAEGQSVKGIGKVGDNLISSISGDVRKFSEYALTNPSKKGLFVDSWGYQLSDAEELLKIYKQQAIEAIKNGKVISNGVDKRGNQVYQIETILNTPLKGIRKIYAGWIVKPDKVDELILSSPLVDR